jgi:hypothetical protein
VIAPHTFAPALTGPTIIVKPSSRKGARVTFQLNVAAPVHYVVTHSIAGRRQRVNGKLRCEAQTQTHKNAHAQVCVRVVTVGSFTEAGTAGANSFRFAGRLSGHRLSFGLDTLIATPRPARPAGQ